MDNYMLYENQTDITEFRIVNVFNKTKHDTNFC